MRRILILNGPNLHALGTREPEVYGRATLADVEKQLRLLAGELDCEVEFRHMRGKYQVIAAF